MRIGKIAMMVVALMAWSVFSALAADGCLEMAKEGPSFVHEKGKCALAGPGKMGKKGKVIDGVYSCKDASGKVTGESVFQKGIRQSVWFYDAEGVKRSFTLNADQKAHGPARMLDAEGRLLCEMTLSAGVLEGAVKEYFPEGKLRRLYFVKNNLREGDFKEYDANGVLMLERLYERDVEMIEKFLYPNGQVQELSVRKPGGKAFTTKTFWPNGKLQSETSYEIKTKPACTTNEATRVGKAYKYAEDGSLLEDVHYDENGRYDGLQIQIDEKGRRMESVYQQGRLVSKKGIATNGKMEVAE